MTRYFSRRHGLSAAAFLVAIATFLVAPMVPAQQMDAGQAKPPTVFVTRDRSLPLQEQPRIENEQTGNRAQFHQNASGAQDEAQPVFLPVVTYDLSGSWARSVALGDLNGDGKLDAAVAILCPTDDPNCYAEWSPGVVTVLLGNGDGTFNVAGSYDTGGEGSAAVIVKDVNGDGNADLLVANECGFATGEYCGSTVSVLLGNGDGSFRPAVTYDSGGFQESPQDVTVPAIASGDVNGDGKPDLVVVNQCDGSYTCDQGTVAVFLGNGDGTFRAPFVYGSGGAWPSGVALGDVNGDGRLDIVLANCGGCGTPGQVGILFGNGDGTFQPVILYDAGGDGTLSVAIADVNGDGNPDLLTSNLAPTGCSDCNYGVMGVLLGNGDGTFRSATTYGPSGILPSSIAVADINGDGQPDVVISSEDGSVNVFPGNPDGTFQPPTAFASGSITGQVVIADLNGDGKRDLVVADLFGSTNSVGAVGVLLNNTVPTGAPTTTTLNSSHNPSVYGQAVTFTAHVAAGSGTPTGTVLFFDGLTSLGSGKLTKGKASLTMSSLSEGAHSITAAYQGSDSFAPSTSVALSQVVNGASTTTSLVSSLNPSVFGQPVTFTAAVSSGAGTPTGIVIFYDGSTSLGSVALASGTAALPPVLLAAGSHSVTAAYQGIVDFKGSTSSPVQQTVQTATTSTSLISTRNPAHRNQRVTYVATVTSQYGGPLTGAVNFQDGGVTVASVNVIGNQAAYTTSYPSPGVHSIAATYTNDPNNSGSTSPVVEEVVGSEPFPSQTMLMTSGSPSHVDQPVTFTATVTSKDGAVPDGETVTFYDGSVQIGIGATAGGISTFTTSSLTAKKHTIKGTYAGDGIFKPSTGKVTQVVEK